MDIHKPKPWHGGREFLKEIGTIVIGVLIALGAEQAVEWLHWRQQAVETRETLHAELARNLGVLEVLRLQDACADQRLSLLDAWADGRARVVSRNLAAVENRTLIPSLRFTAWEVAKSGSVANHMPISDRLLYGDLYDRLGTQTANLLWEKDAWRQLSRYAGKVDLNPDEARRLKEDLGMIRSSTAARSYNLPDFEQRFQALGIKPKLPQFPPGVAGFPDLCKPPN
ncbi:hypothetical protein [Phenylobacterium sp.]|uniref:hypothetical protein n=1 Tax=Phenylobacterium sp. TaxID=1871053 RepID=UPI00374D2800